MTLPSTRRAVSPYAAWAVREADFPHGGPLRAQLAFLLRYAVLAPSAHNTQPWQFAVRGNRVRVALDPTRVLAVSDPTHREAWLSVGACVENLVIAAAHAGFRATLEEFPPGVPEAVADLVMVADAAARTPERNALFAAIPRRHTNRFLFEARPVPTETLARFSSLTSVDPALHLVTEQARIEALADITLRAVAASMGDPAFRRELSRWVRNNFTKRPDGMPGFAVGVPALPSLLAPLIVRLPPAARAEAKKRRAQVSSAPLVAIITTRGDDHRAWLRAGMLLERLWLAATAEGLRVGVLAAAVETQEFFRDVQRVLSTRDRPQAFVRIGFGPPDPHPTPRRDVSNVAAWFVPTP